MKPLTLLLSLTLLSPLAYAEMKCESGKCTSGKATNEKKVPSKPTSQAASKKSTDTPLPKKTKPEANKPKKERTVRPTVKQLFNVTTTRVFRETVVPEQVNYGYIVADEAKRTDVVAWYSGYVIELYVDTRYRKVKKGEALALVYAPEVYKAKQDYLNSLNFNAKRPSPAMVRSSRLKLKLLNVSEKEIARIRPGGVVEKYTTLYAPADGWLFDKRIEAGSAFKNGMKLFEIVDLGTVWMEAKLYQEQLAKLNRFIRFSVIPEGFSEQFEAQKELLYPRLDPKEATATLRLRIENPKGVLLPGMYAKLYASTKPKARLLVPRSAVIRKKGEWYAFLATEFKGEYEPVKVQVAPLDNRYFEVLDGLNEGEEVVNNALFMMDSDAQINSIY